MLRNQLQCGFEVDDSNPCMSSTVHERSEVKHQAPIASGSPEIEEPDHDNDSFLYAAVGTDVTFAVDQPAENLYDIVSILSLNSQHLTCLKTCHPSLYSSTT